MDLLKQPETRRLLQSAQVALPLTEDPLGDLAAGLRMERRAMEEGLALLQREGAVTGFRGEPNPHLAGARETLVQSDAPPTRSPGEIIRWTGQGSKDQWCRSAMRLQESPDGASSRFLKVGFLLSFEDGPERLLDAGGERSLLTQGEPMEMPPLPGDAAKLVEALVHPVRFDPSADLWKQIAGAAEMERAGVRPAMRYLLQAGVIRRFALALSPAALDWQGCGLACWDFQEVGRHLLPDAGRALAGLRGTGDVVQRETELHALFLGREPGIGETAAREVARQWGRPLARWDSLQIRTERATPGPRSAPG